MMEVIEHNLKTESLKSPIQDEFFDAEDKEGKHNFHMNFGDELFYFFIPLCVCLLLDTRL